MTARWPSRRLGEIFQIARGGSPRPIEKFITADPAGLNWVKIGDATASGKFIERTKEKIKPEGLSKSRFVNAGDFLLTNSMSFGRPYIMATDGCIHDGWLVLKPHDRAAVYQDYFYHLLGSDEIYKKLAARASGSTVKNLSTEIVAGIEVSIPPLDEQRRIAVILDKADALRRKRKRALDLSKDLGRSIFLQMFGDPVDNPKGITKVPLGDLIKVKSGNGLVAKDMALNGLYPVYGGNGINGYHNQFMFEHPKLVIGRVGVYCGAVHLTEPMSWVTDNALIVSEIKRPISEIYLKYALTETNLNQYAGRAAQPLISGSRIYPVAILIPSMTDQMDFEQAVIQLEKHRGLLACAKDSTDGLFFSLQNRAFSGLL